jgi:predicted secreted protein
MHKRAILVSLLLLAALAAGAGDAAVFQNLGFSPNVRYFMFALYGVKEKTTLPYAELYTVDVARNRFVSGGVRKIVGKAPVEPGNDGCGALLNLLAETQGLTKKYGIDHTLTGRLVYILLDGAEPKPELEFRDFQADRKYRIVLNQSSVGSGEGISSSFHLVVTVEDGSGRICTYTVGDPDFWRKGVRQYRIRQVILAPDSLSLIFVMEKELEEPSGADIRYMVETLKLQA